MPKLHLHSWEENEDGDLVEVEHDLVITGPVRVQATTDQGFQSFEMGTKALQAVEIFDEEPAAEEPAAKSETKSEAKSKSSS